MKYLITAIAALALVGCGPSVEIHEAARTGNIEVVKQYLAAGGDVNAKNDDGYTPLHVSAHGDTKEIAELLITNGADVNAKAAGGWTPLHSAAERGHKEITQLLIAKGVDVNTRNDRRRTPLDYVVNNAVKTNNRDEIIELLRKNGGKTAEEFKAEGK